MLKQTIRTNIVTIFLVLIAIVSFSLLSSQYYFNNKLAVESADKTFTLITKNLTQHLTQNNHRIEKLLESNFKNKTIFEEIAFDSNHSSLDDLTKILNTYKGIHALYFANKNGSLYEIINMKNAQKLFRLYKAPKETKWTNIIRINGKSKYSFLDENRDLISSYTVEKKYNSTQRTWYKDAIYSKKLIMTEPYLFANLDENGITYALELEQKGTVLAIDYTLEMFNYFLQLQKFDESSEIFLFNKEGYKVASSDEDFKDIVKIHPQLEKSFFENKRGIIKYNQNDRDYFSSYYTIESSDLFLGIEVDTYNLLKPYIDNTKYSFSISFLLLLLSIPIIFMAVKSIVKPIEALIEENEKIKNREFTKVAAVKTNIIEFIELSDSLVSMSHSINEYQKSQEALLN